MQTPFNVTVQREVVVMVVVTAVVVEVVVVIQRIARVDYVHLPDEKEKEIYIYFINTCNKYQWYAYSVSRVSFISLLYHSTSFSQLLKRHDVVLWIICHT